MTNPQATCRLCARMSLEQTSCDLYGPMLPDELDDAALGRMCVRLGQFVRRLHGGTSGIGLPRRSGSGMEAADEGGMDGDREFRVLRGIPVEEWGDLSPNAKPPRGQRLRDEEDRHEHAGPWEAADRGRHRASRRDADEPDPEETIPDEAFFNAPPRDSR
ncbi:hypothetical protein I8J29_25115 [Paenibacillus sp. MWE-103]|uniref:Uncharacterized protein n=1 Tax=Paenibacillus artemisiicola TaxID=1172618 RepID=A0ABS3WGP8_9BACL|nr:hypothetical protein [Paenibacillus artemisiicola]MBO7747472.1 hypothetical protein [Paenibacillus artemisiicola]